jgi:hypothetical protein
MSAPIVPVVTASDLLPAAVLMAAIVPAGWYRVEADGRDGVGPHVAVRLGRDGEWRSMAAWAAADRRGMARRVVQASRSGRRRYRSAG